jgi:hypothetical protein
MPYALYSPGYYREAFLGPGKHQISVDILLSVGTGCGFSCEVSSGKNCYDLSINKDSIYVPGQD